MVEKTTEKQIIHQFDEDKLVELGDGRWEINRNPNYGGKQVNIKSPLGFIWVNPNQKKIKQSVSFKLPKITAPNIIKKWWSKLRNYWKIEGE